MAANMFGVALGAAADEINRARSQERANSYLDIARQNAEQDRSDRQQISGLRRIEINRAQQAADDEASVRKHIEAWRGGRERIMKGDFSDILAGIDEYNQNQGWANDGYTIRPRTSPDGKASILDFVGPDGNVVRSTGPLMVADGLKLYDLGMAEKLKWLSPARYDAATKANAAAREAQMNRDSVERRAQMSADARMYGADTRANSAIETADIRADAQRYNADHRPAKGALTLPQERTNAEIDAARKAVEDMSDEEIRKRTTPTTATGRENADFDPALARAAKLASRRKVGADDWFDQQSGQGQQQPAVAGKPLADLTAGQLQQLARQAGNESRLKIDAELASRSLAGMPGMEGHTVGKFVDGKGFQVLDSQGRLVSYLRRKAQ